MASEPNEANAQINQGSGPSPDDSNVSGDSFCVGVGVFSSTPAAAIHNQLLFFPLNSSVLTIYFGVLKLHPLPEDMI